MLRGPARTLIALAGSLTILAGGATALATTTPAAGASTVPTTTPTIPSTPTVPTTPAPPPVKASAKIYLRDLFIVKRHAVTVPRRMLRVGIVVHPYIPGQWIRVRAFLHHRVIKTKLLLLERAGNGTYGRLSMRLKSPRAGIVTVLVGHSTTPQMTSFLAHRSFAVLNENVGFGATGRFVQLIQQRLAALHFYIPQTGVYDQGTGLAVDAYHRLLHWGTYQTLDGRTISFLLNGWGKFQVRYPHDGKHAEGNLSLQLLALVNGSHVHQIYPISSGKPSTPTILGRFRVYYRVPGYLPDGMYYSSFFYGGYAIHGYDPAPDYPASHGCMRLPIVDAISAYDWLNYGYGVDTYD